MADRAAESSCRHRRIRIGDLIFDRETGEIWSPGEADPQRLRPRSAKLLDHLARHPGRLCSRPELQELLWGDREVDAEQGLNACVRDVRRRLGDNASRPTIVETLPGRGYRLIAPVALEPEASRERTSPRMRSWMLVGLLSFVVFATTGVRSVRVPADLDTIDGEARNLLREADYLAKSGDPEALLRSIRLLEQALALEPSWPLAHAELAQISLMAGETERAAALAARALALDPTLAEAQAAAGFFAFYDRLDWREAEQRLEHAVELDPASSAARHAFSHVLSAKGEHDRAMQHMGVAVELDPVDARLRGDACWIFYWARRFSEAIAHADKTLEIAPDDSPALVCLFNARVAAGDLEAAAQQIEELAERMGMPQRFRAALQVQSAEERVRSYWRYVGDNPDRLLPVPSHQRLRAFGQLGLRDAARRELARISSGAAEADLIFLRLDPLLDPIRDLFPPPPT
ncbi:MAG: winged helix-turn-helix domain-containing protein [Holophagales bacterium]|nr:winged helix-turn-helix domain-containing protein [Holophagales bacterium]